MPGEGRAQARAGNTTGSNGRGGESHGSRRQRPKCTYPSCGKFGHLESNCWKAHPELRPRQAWGRGRGRHGRGGFGQHGTTSAIEGPQAENEWTVEHTGNWSVTPPTPTFRLFDLPQEIQDRIYKHLYVEKYGASVYIVDNSNYARDYRQHGLQKYFVFRTTSYSVELACKKLRDDTHLLRKDAFNGHLHVDFHEDYGWQAMERLCSESFAWLQIRVTDLKMAGFSGRAISGRVFDASTWEQDLDLLKHFPEVTTIEIKYDITKYKYQADMDDIETDEWRRLQEPGADQAFLDGTRDNEFSYPASMLGIWDLRAYMKQKSHECAIYMSVHVQWMSDRYYRIYEEVSTFLAQFEQTADSKCSRSNS
ncbi:hypothetical protein EDD37DRAFT_681251 [Exophiala viscosa]|uniref:Uncharacterized protein n=1 Tax=Exophiala viscosa TaxID=2486360 RepID=A0AAN6IER8_9EURO|nr:hypothetical protein EDD36DRAFT_163833 [Exophiala viscosa]KAI1624353.1 hypothetical protein EDD37DRAFT_681251 [Exophiala viscosa]